MRRDHLFLALRLIALMFFLNCLVACNTAPPPTVATNQPEVMVKEPTVGALVRANSVLLDVRPSYESQGVKVPNSLSMNTSDLGLKEFFGQNNFPDIHGVFRRYGLTKNTPVVLIGDSSRDLYDMGYVGVVLWAFGVKNIDVSDIAHWRVRPVESAPQVPQGLTTDIENEPQEIEVQRTYLDTVCSPVRCQCAGVETENLPRRFIAACDVVQINPAMFWSKDRVFKESARTELANMKLDPKRPVYFPWTKQNLFPAWAMHHLGYDVKFVRLGR